MILSSPYVCTPYHTTSTSSQYTKFGLAMTPYDSKSSRTVSQLLLPMATGSVNSPNSTSAYSNGAHLAAAGVRECSLHSSIGLPFAVTVGSVISHRRLRAGRYTIGTSNKVGIIIQFFILLLISLSLFASKFNLL